MRSIHQPWPARLIAVVTTLALVFASVMGAYGHAAGHSHHSSPGVAHTQGVDQLPPSADTRAAHADCDHSHNRADTGSSHADCLDIICHGGYAILGATCIVPLLARALPFIVQIASLIGTQPGSLERPPRPPVLA